MLGVSHWRRSARPPRGARRIVTIGAFCAATGVAPAVEAGGFVTLAPQVSWVRDLPTVSFSDQTNASTRTVPPGAVPFGGPLTFAGVHFDSAITTRHLVVPMLGLGFGMLVGEQPMVVSSLDGSVVNLHPWSAYRVEVLGPGIGLRMTERRWTLSATMRSELVIMAMSASLAAGAGTAEMPDATAVGLGARVELEACRRVDPTDRACILVAPTLYEFGFLNGGVLALRWEWGR
jgi:hypothetical protein